MFYWIENPKLNHRIQTCEINKHFLLGFYDKIHVLSNGYDELALGY